MLAGFVFLAMVWTWDAVTTKCGGGVLPSPIDHYLIQLSYVDPVLQPCIVTECCAFDQGGNCTKTCEVQSTCVTYARSGWCTAVTVPQPSGSISVSTAFDIPDPTVVNEIVMMRVTACYGNPGGPCSDQCSE